MRILKETDQYVIIERGDDRRRRRKEKKFLCIGGPRAGQRAAWCQVDTQGYTPFNRAFNRSRIAARQHTQIWVHDSLLNETRISAGI